MTSFESRELRHPESNRSILRDSKTEEGLTDA